MLMQISILPTTEGEHHSLYLSFIKVTILYSPTHRTYPLHKAQFKKLSSGIRYQQFVGLTGIEIVSVHAKSSS